jgi:hypothetical protein
MKAKTDQEYLLEQGNRHVDLSFSGMGQQLSGYSGGYQHRPNQGWSRNSGQGRTRNNLHGRRSRSLSREGRDEGRGVDYGRSSGHTAKSFQTGSQPQQRQSEQGEHGSEDPRKGSTDISAAFTQQSQAQDSTNAEQAKAQPSLLRGQVDDHLKADAGKGADQAQVEDDLIFITSIHSSIPEDELIEANSPFTPGGEPQEGPKEKETQVPTQSPKQTQDEPANKQATQQLTPAPTPDKRIPGKHTSKASQQSGLRSSTSHEPFQGSRVKSPARRLFQQVFEQPSKPIPSTGQELHKRQGITPPPQNSTPKRQSRSSRSLIVRLPTTSRVNELLRWHLIMRESSFDEITRTLRKRTRNLRSLTS